VRLDGGSVLHGEIVRPERQIDLEDCCPEEPTGRVEFELLLGKLRKLSDKMNT
jgi:hypothetical protein